MEDLERPLRAHPFMADLEPERVRSLVGCASNIRFRPGEYLVREGEGEDRLFLIRQGTVSIEMPRPNGAASVVETANGHVCPRQSLLTTFLTGRLPAPTGRRARPPASSPTTPSSRTAESRGSRSGTRSLITAPDSTRSSNRTSLPTCSRRHSRLCTTATPRSNGAVRQSGGSVAKTPDHFLKRRNQRLPRVAHPGRWTIGRPSSTEYGPSNRSTSAVCVTRPRPSHQ